MRKFLCVLFLLGAMLAAPLSADASVGGGFLRARSSVSRVNVNVNQGRLFGGLFNRNRSAVRVRVFNRAAVNVNVGHSFAVRSFASSYAVPFAVNAPVYAPVIQQAFEVPCGIQQQVFAAPAAYAAPICAPVIQQSYAVYAAPVYTAPAYGFGAAFAPSYGYGASFSHGAAFGVGRGFGSGVSVNVGNAVRVRVR